MKTCNSCKKNYNDNKVVDGLCTTCSWYTKRGKLKDGVIKCDSCGNNFDINSINSQCLCKSCVNENTEQTKNKRLLKDIFTTSSLILIVVIVIGLVFSCSGGEDEKPSRKTTTKTYKETKCQGLSKYTNEYEWNYYNCDKQRHSASDFN